MGNGQCHECCGCEPRRGWHTKTVGHKQGCGIAEAIQELGGKVVWERENHSRSRRELNNWLKKAFTDKEWKELETPPTSEPTPST